jgi:hypothetical protein
MVPSHNLKVRKRWRLMMADGWLDVGFIILSSRYHTRARSRSADPSIARGGVG